MVTGSMRLLCQEHNFVFHAVWGLYINKYETTCVVEINQVFLQMEEVSNLKTEI